MSTVITEPSGVREQYAALRAQITALEKQVAIQNTTIEDLLAQRERLDNLAQRVEELVAALGAVRAERDAATEQIACLRNAIVLLETRLTTQERVLHIAGLHVARAQLRQQLAEIDRLETQTQTLFGGAGIMVGAGWGMLGGPVGMLIGALAGSAANLVLGAEEVLQPTRQERARIETRIRQIDQELMALGHR